MTNFLNIILLFFVFISASFVVMVQHQSRQYYVALDKAERQEIELEQEYTRLKNAQTKVGNHSFVKRVAERQKMHSPLASEIQIIELK